MKAKYRLFLTIFVTLVIVSQSMATGVIARVSDPSRISDLIDDYPAIIGVQHAGHSPFFRFEVNDEFIGGFANTLELDDRVMWAETERSTVNQGHSSHGSSVAAIFDRKLNYDLNPSIFTQISFQRRMTEGTPIKVGIVDTGFSPYQLSMMSRVVARESFVEGSIYADDLPANLDTNMNGIFDEGAGHGTLVASVILQMSPNSPLIIAKSADSDGMATPWSVLEGVVFCVENGAKVVNLSLGSPGQLVGFDRFLDWVDQSGTVIVSPIGNNAANMALYPAGYAKVICVTGLLPDNTKAPFSNWSSSATVSAPATGISGSWYGGDSSAWSGTSLSAPIVSGCLAAALSTSASKSPSEIRWAVKHSGRDIDDLNPFYRGQLGRLLDFAKLVRTLRD